MEEDLSEIHDPSIGNLKDALGRVIDEAGCEEVCNGLTSQAKRSKVTTWNVNGTSPTGKFCFSIQ